MNRSTKGLIWFFGAFLLAMSPLACFHAEDELDSDGAEGDADTDTDTDSDTDTDTDSDADSDTDTDSDADSDTDTDSDTDGDEDTEPTDEWLCDPNYYGSNDGCDCGCGVTDPDCGSGGCTEPGCYAEDCQYCWWDDNNYAPCIPATEEGGCPVGQFSYYTIFCTEHESCQDLMEELGDGSLNTEAQLAYPCESPDEICCALYGT